MKVKKVFGTETTDYLDGFQYTNSILKFFPTAEGYFNIETGKYVYNYTDHLGNVRLSYAKNGAGTEIIEESNYYPFGLKHEGYNVLTGNPLYKYKYNGKELQETGMYDYGARMYMPDLGRWGTQDDLSELQLHYSPYSYVFNNPFFFNDPTGMIGESFGNGEDPKKKKKDEPTKTVEIQEIVITKYNVFKSKANDVLMFIAPIRPNTKEEMEWHTARYGKYGNGILSDLKIVGNMITDVPNLLSESFNSIGESDDKTEIVAATAILLINLKKGKAGNIAKMGNLGGRFMKLAKLLKLNINSSTTMSILENVDKPVQEFISTHRKGSIKAVFPAEHLNSTVKEALQSGNTTVRKLLTDSRFLK